jgi:hypothetical protein
MLRIFFRDIFLLVSMVSAYIVLSFVLLVLLIRLSGTLTHDQKMN